MVDRLTDLALGIGIPRLALLAALAAGAWMLDLSGQGQ